MRLVMAMVLAGLVALPLSANAQAGEEGTNLQEPAPSAEPASEEPAPAAEPAPEEPALQLKLDDAGVEVAPTPLRTPDGYTLEEMDVRVRRAKIGLGSSAAALFAGGMFVGFGIGESLSDWCFFEECAPVPKRYVAYVWTGTALLVGGFAGMVASGILLRSRKRDRDSLRAAHYTTPRRVQWDLAQSRLVF
jgi:hypothetical protein